MAVTVRPCSPQPCLAFASSTAAASTRCIEGARRPIWSCVRFRPPVCVRPCLRTRIYIRPCLRTIHDFDAVCVRGYVRCARLRGACSRRRRSWGLCLRCSGTPRTSRTAAHGRASGRSRPPSCAPISGTAQPFRAVVVCVLPYATVPCRYGVVKQSYMQCLCGLPVMFPAVVIAPLRLVSFALSRATGSAQTLLSEFEPVKRLPPHHLSSNPSQCDWRLRQGHDP